MRDHGVSLSPGTILLVEDEASDALLIQRALCKADVASAIQVVEDGETAIAYLAGSGAYADRERHPLPVLVLLDLKMPRKSGFEVLVWLRAQPGLRRLPVVVLTSSKEPADIRRAHELGANSYLVKPLAFDALLEMVQALSRYWLVWSENPDLRTGDRE